METTGTPILTDLATEIENIKALQATLQARLDADQEVLQQIDTERSEDFDTFAIAVMSAISV